MDDLDRVELLFSLVPCRTLIAPNRAVGGCFECNQIYEYEYVWALHLRLNPDHRMWDNWQTARGLANARGDG